MNRTGKSRLRLALALLVGAPLLAGSGNISCGGSGGTSKYHIGVSQEDDTCNGMTGNCSKAGGSSGTGAGCGGSGECSCSLGSMGYCGVCSSSPPGKECVYCPQGFYCPPDPCTNLCVSPNHQGNRCPTKHPVQCGDGCCDSGYVCSTNKVCCPTGFPVVLTSKSFFSREDSTRPIS
jgi:hypothetical protein